MVAPERLFTAISIDVEEEGLFCGRYERINPTIINARHLDRLEPFLERGVKFTLFCSHASFMDAQARAALARLRDRGGAEIGAHLHHWNTPPLEGSPDASGPVPAAKVSQKNMAAKLATLFRAARDFQGGPVESFRMGRWDLHSRFWPLLQENGVLCDASVRPMHFFASGPDGPDHFNAPADPYWAGDIFEIPATATPLCGCLPELLRQCPPFARASARHWAALAILPIEHPLWLLKLAARLHARQGGRALSFTWHSSEMMPGGAPHMPDRESVDKFIARMLAFLDWLEDNYDISYLTMGEMRAALGASSPRPLGAGDWLPQKRLAGERAHA